ncbi:MAG: hypothetical protein JW705_03925 [Methanosarcinaceae archaeon]|nr:hypothetical protein [Methanosarcinaceae archaeon]
MTASSGLQEYDILVVIALILLLSIKEIMSASDRWNKSLECFFYIAIIPLLVSFVAIIIFKISEMI